MNPKRCMKCLVHGLSATHQPDECDRFHCDCHKCKLIDRRRDVTTKLVRLSRKQKIDLNCEDDYETRYMCSKCRNHGVVAIKKYHIPCPFAACQCQSCDLNEEKRGIDNELSAIHHNEKMIDSSPLRSMHTSSEEPIQLQNDPLTPEAKVILDLIHVLALDPSSFNPDNFDYRALSNFFNQETIDVPKEWISELPNIFFLVNEALKKFPILKDIDFQTGFNCTAIQAMNI